MIQLIDSRPLDTGTGAFLFLIQYIIAVKFSVMQVVLLILFVPSMGSGSHDADMPLQMGATQFIGDWILDWVARVS